VRDLCVVMLKHYSGKVLLFASNLDNQVSTQAVSWMVLLSGSIDVLLAHFMNRALWIAQVLLALLFLFAGGAKLVVPVAEMAKQVGLPGMFLRFVGVVEVLGAIGLILPGLLGIRPGLTPLAAAGLVVIMIGATVITLQLGPVPPALFPFATDYFWCSSLTAAGR
jgi:uncharacterized membrane protein YphA (DoxX/SURF4 family)